jgi:protein-S-isoprenylcysteine O-methyltransferase Ste14
MPTAERSALIGLGLTFLAVGIYHRIRAAQSGDRLERTKEGWPTLIGLRLAGLATFGSTAAWLWNPPWFAWAAFPVPDWARWIGVGGFAFGVTWLIWMFISLGPNLTDTVVTRREARFVDRGPYRYVRNPMYSGILMIGPSLGLALGTCLLPLAATVMFAVLARRTRTEEIYLIAHFGDQYRTYMANVGRFFPRLTRPERRVR